MRSVPGGHGTQCQTETTQSPLRLWSYAVRRQATVDWPGRRAAHAWRMLYAALCREAGSKRKPRPAALTGRFSRACERGSPYAGTFREILASGVR